MYIYIHTHTPPYCITICILHNHQNKNLALKNDKNHELDLIKGKNIVSM